MSENLAYNEISTEPDIAAKLEELERQNQELAAKVAAMEEEKLAADFRVGFSALHQLWLGMVRK